MERLDGVEIRQRAAEPAFGDVKLAAFLGGFLDALLRLLFGADKHHLAALADGGGQEIARRFELRERLAEVNDVNAVARVEDERLHLGVPTLRLVSEMDARFQQFFNANTNHNFPLVANSSPGLKSKITIKSFPATVPAFLILIFFLILICLQKTIPRNTGLMFDVVRPPPSLKGGNSGPFPFRQRRRKGDAEYQRNRL